MNNMRNQTFGVEVEMNSITRENASKIAAKFFGTGKFKYTGMEDGYKTWSAYDSQGIQWKFMRDASIYSRIDEEKCEMVTPILKYEDIETLQELLRQLRNEGAKSDASRDCGIHIHIGADGHTPKTIKNLVNMMASHEELISKALRLNSYRLERWCKVVNKNFLKAINEKCPKTMEELADMWYSTNTPYDSSYARSEHYNDSRYHMLNLHATFTKGTIEFRLFQFDTPTLGKDGKYHGGIHAGQLKAYIQFCLALSNRAKEMSRASYKVTKYYESDPLNAMLSWLRRIELDYTSEEFKTAGIILTKNLTKKAMREAV